MKTRFIFSLLLGAGLFGATAGAHAANVATLTLADQPVRLIRGAAIYKGINGSAVQKEDILETAASGVHIEAGPDAIVAIGPQSRVYVISLATDARSGTELALLKGWVKVLSKTPKRALVVTPNMVVTFASGATIVQSKPGKDALFAEEGAQQAVKVDDKGRAGPPLKVAAEQYAVVDPAKPLLVAGRPARDFLAEMPLPFRDPLVRARPVPKAGTVPPVKEHDVDYADVDAWLLTDLPVRKNFVNRFKARLADPSFRKPLEQALGQSSDWKFVLHPSVSTGSTIY